MEAEDVVELYTLLPEHSVQIWIDGGWDIDWPGLVGGKQLKFIFGLQPGLLQTSQNLC